MNFFDYCILHPYIFIYISFIVGGLSRPPTEVSSVSTDNIPDFLTDGTKDFLSADLPSDDPAGGVGCEGPPSYRCVLAHKLVLKMKSPVFKRQFFGSLREAAYKKRFFLSGWATKRGGGGKRNTY